MSIDDTTIFADGHRNDGLDVKGGGTGYGGVARHEAADTGGTRGGLDCERHSPRSTARSRRHGRAAQLAVKRMVDVVGSALLLVVLSPLLLTIAVAVKVTSPGPALFSQIRTGFNGRTFRIYKFRSMYQDRGDASGITQTIADDPRATPIGKVMRQTDLDELPQLFNVFLGDMSFVGPRPHVVNMLAGGKPYEELVSFYSLRHAMRPGITGLAQVQGLRGPTVDPEKAKLRVIRDVEYIRDFSLWLDLKIVWMTIVNEARGGSGF